MKQPKRENQVEEMIKFLEQHCDGTTVKKGYCESLAIQLVRGGFELVNRPSRLTVEDKRRIKKDEDEIARVEGNMVIVKVIHKNKKVFQFKHHFDKDKASGFSDLSDAFDWAKKKTRVCIGIE